MVLAFPLSEATAKIRRGPPVDDEGDVDLPVWAGVIPLRLEGGRPLAADDVPDDIPTPAYLTGYGPERRKPSRDD